MKKQNKNAKQKNIIERINDWFITPEDKYSKKIPADKMIVDTLHYDFMVSVLVVSVLINMAAFFTWLAAVTTPGLALVVL